MLREKDVETFGVGTNIMLKWKLNGVLDGKPYSLSVSYYDKMRNQYSGFI